MRDNAVGGEQVVTAWSQKQSWAFLQVLSALSAVILTLASRAFENDSDIYMLVACLQKDDEWYR